MYKFFVGIIAYLVIISTIIGFVVYDAKNTQMDGINIGNTLQSDRVEFTEIDEYVDAKLLDRSYWTVTNNTLVFSGIHPSWSDLLLKGIQTDSEGYYTIEYTIVNPENSRYRIIIQKSGLFDGDSVYLIYDGTKFTIPEPSINIPILTLVSGELYHYPVSNLIDEHTVKTRYNHDSGHIMIYLNDEYIGDSYYTSDSTPSHFGGIGVYDNHLLVTGITTNIQITEEPSFLDLFGLIGSVLVYTIDEEYFPWIYNLLLIKLPIAMLIIGLAFWSRGVP